MANLVDANTSGMESTLGLWVTSGTNTTLTRSSTQARTGSFSAKLVATAGADYAKMITSTYVTGVTAGDAMTFEWYAFPTSSNMYYEADVDWYTSGGVYISSSFYSNLPGPLAVNTWNRCFINGTAPATATKAILQVQMFAAGAGDVCYVDDVYFGLQHSIIVAGDGPVQSLIGSYGGYGSTGVSTTGTLESSIARTFNVASDYMPHAAWSDFTESTLRTNQLDGWATWRAARPGSKLVFGVPVVTDANVGDFAGVVAGTYDTYFTAAANALLHSGNGDAWVMLGWEANNANIGPWQACDNPSGFISAYQHIVTLMKGISSSLKFIWSSSLYITAGKTLTSLSSYYPGDSYVDFVGYNVYDMGYDNDSRNDFQKHWAFQVNVAGGMQEFRSFAVSHSKPECIPEWGMLLSGGATNGGGDNPAFVANMAAWFGSSPNLAYQSYYNLDWDSSRGSALTHFTTGAAAYKSRIGAQNAVETAGASPYFTSVFSMVPGEIQPGADWPGSVTVNSTSAADGDTGAATEAATVRVVSADTGSGVDNVSTRSVPTADTGSGADNATVRVIATETGSGVDDVLTRTVKPDTDTAAGTDLATVRVIATTESGSGADTATPSAQIPAADTAAGLDDTTVRVFAAETGAGLDSGFIVTGTFPAADTGSGLDTATVRVLATGDTGAAADSAFASNTAIVDDPGTALDVSTVRVPVADTGAGVDTAVISALVPSNDTGSGVDTATVRAYAAETASGLDAAGVGLPVADTGAGVDTAPQPIAVTFGADPITSVEVATVLITGARDTGSFVEKQIRGVVGIADETLRTFVIEAEGESVLHGDVDNRTFTADVDPETHLFCDIGGRTFTVASTDQDTDLEVYV